MKNLKSGCHAIWLGCLAFILLPVALLTMWIGWGVVRHAPSFLDWDNYHVLGIGLLLLLSVPLFAVATIDEWRKNRS
ncbi:MAG: hypothetical protein Kow0080_14850 [Candidatus Promineifilaceae bacterium]